MKNNKGRSSKSNAKMRKSQTTPEEAIRQLCDVEELLNKKVAHLEARINEETTIARRDLRTNRHNAIKALKRKKKLEKDLQQTDGTLTTLECHREALQNAAINTQVVTALKSATSALDGIHKGLGVDDIQDIMDDLEEQREIAEEITKAISSPVGFGEQISDHEIEDELAKLEQEETQADMIRINLPTNPTHSIPVYNQPANVTPEKQSFDDRVELERWALLS